MYDVEVYVCFCFVGVVTLFPVCSLSLVVTAFAEKILSVLPYDFDLIPPTPVCFSSRCYPWTENEKIKRKMGMTAGSRLTRYSLRAYENIDLERRKNKEKMLE